MKLYTLIFSFLVFLCTAISFSAMAEDAVKGPVFKNNDVIEKPANVYKWVFIGGSITPNALNNGKALFPETHSTYVEPSAFDHYLKTGEWANGTQIAKLRTMLKTGDNCDAKTGICTGLSGKGYFQGDVFSMVVMVKDTNRFTKEKGGWKYYNFGAPPYTSTAKAFPSGQCSGCHMASSEAKDSIFVDNYPILRAAKK